MKVLIGFVVVMAGFASTFGCAIATLDLPYQCQIEPAPGENFGYTTAQIWLPRSPSDVRGILCVILHPIGKGGSTLAHPREWIEMANAKNYALMSISFAESDDKTLDWCQADRGSGRALLASISGFARQTGFGVLETVPIVTIGVCAAGQFAFHLAAFIPTRVAAFVTIGGGKHDLSKVGQATLVTGLLVMTPDRGPRVPENLQHLYTEGRILGARWQLLSEPIAKYDEGFCSSRVCSFLQEGMADVSDMATGPLTKSDTTKNSEWLAISICGEALKPQIVVQPLRTFLKPLFCLSEAEPQVLKVNTIPRSIVDAISTATSDSAMTTDIQRIGSKRWTIECRIDPSKLPLGPFKISVAIRYRSKGKTILGGESATFTGINLGPVTWNPFSLDLGAIKMESVRTGQLKFETDLKQPFQVAQISSPFTWIEIDTKNQDRQLIVTCTAKPSIFETRRTFAGYIRLKLKSPINKTIKILCYGSLINK